jgi:hypothetical protein
MNQWTDSFHPLEKRHEMATKDQKTEPVPSTAASSAATAVATIIPKVAITIEWFNANLDRSLGEIVMVDSGTTITELRSILIQESDFFKDNIVDREKMDQAIFLDSQLRRILPSYTFYASTQKSSEKHMVYVAALCDDVKNVQKLQWTHFDSPTSALENSDWPRSNLSTWPRRGNNNEYDD